MLGRTKETLFTVAASLVLLGPWQVWFAGHGLSPRPTVKKNLRSTFWGTLAGNFAFARLRILRLNFIEYAESLNFGSLGLRRGSFGLLAFGLVDFGSSYSRNPVTVVLSKAAGPVAYGRAAIMKVALGALGMALRRTLVVCPGVMSTVLVLKGFT